ncbi:MAG: hypothetical protein RSB96_03565, partial [Oscillospiraceae bacterium]
MKIKKATTNIFSVSIFLSLFLISTVTNLFVFNRYPELDSFKDRVVSHATVMGYDVGKRVNAFYLFLVVIVILCIAVYSLFTKVLNSTKTDEKIRIIGLLEELSTFGLVAMAYGYLVGTMDLAITYIGIFVVIITALLCMVKNLKVYIIEWAMLLSMPITVFLLTVPFSNWENSSKSYIVIGVTFIIIIGISCLAYKIGEHKLSEEKITALLVKSSFPLFLTALVQSVLIELFNILNRRGIIIVDNLKLVYLMLVLGAIAFGILLFIIERKQIQPFIIKHTLQKHWYIIFMITIIMLVAQPMRTATSWNEYFETANHGLALDGLFRYGQIPIVENFDAHMLHNQLYGMLYSLFNGYEPWSFILYREYVLIPFYTIIYLFMSNIIGKRAALMLVVTLPFVVVIFPVNLIYVALLLLYLFKMMDTTEIKSSVPFWFIIAGITALTLDMGIAAAIAGIIGYITILILKKQHSLKPYIKFGIEG